MQIMHILSVAKYISNVYDPSDMGVLPSVTQTKRELIKTMSQEIRRIDGL